MEPAHIVNVAAKCVSITIEKGGRHTSPSMHVLNLQSDPDFLYWSSDLWIQRHTGHVTATLLRLAVIPVKLSKAM